MHRVPVTLDRRPGYEDVPESYISPVIEIEVAGANLSSSGISPSGTPSLKIKALIDTGCDEFHIDESVLMQVGAPQCLDQNVSTTTTIHGETINCEYIVFLSIPGTDIKTLARVVSRSFPGSKRAYQAILGMELIRIGRLVIDASGESYLELPPP